MIFRQYSQDNKRCIYYVYRIYNFLIHSNNILNYHVRIFVRQKLKALRWSQNKGKNSYATIKYWHCEAKQYPRISDTVNSNSTCISYLFFGGTDLFKHACLCSLSPDCRSRPVNNTSQCFFRTRGQRK